MVDYTVAISASSTMMIRDTGGWVEFWFKTGPQTWANQQQWSYFANGAFSGTRQFRLLRGGNWQLFGSVYVTYDQNVTFSIAGHGSSFPPYNFNQHIQRSTVPAPPTMQSVTPISSSTFHVVFQGSYDGGSPVLEWQIGYGSSSNGPTSFVGSSGTSDVGGFSSGQRIYFWARGRNALGWSGWSNRGEGTTWTVPSAPVKQSVSNITQTSFTVVYLFGDRTNNAPVLETQVGYGQSLVAPTDFATAVNGVTNLTDLDPGGIYYTWGRSRNSVGWGPWSARTETILIAGARVLVGAQWKRAVPYVRDDGVWKVAEPWVKSAGTWKRPSV